MPRLGKRATVASILLVVGTVGLITGAVIAVLLPSSTMFWSDSRGTAVEVAAEPSATSSPPPTPVRSPTAETAQPRVPEAAGKRSPDPKPRKRSEITYVVKSGDTLFGIAAWFKQHGYQALYEKNRKVIGADPDLIRPGQRITISRDGAMKISRPD